MEGWTRKEWEMVSEALDGEIEFLRRLGRRGVPTVRGVSFVSGLQSKVADEIERLAKLEAEETKKRTQEEEKKA